MLLSALTNELATFMVAAMTIGTTVGVAYSFARRQTSKDLVETANTRAEDWRDVAEQRAAKLADVEREVKDLTTELRAAAETISALRARPNLDGLVTQMKKTMETNSVEHQAIIAQIASVAELLAKKGAS